MSVQICRPRISDLVFQVFGRPLHPELFDVLATRQVHRDGNVITVRITRTGHVATWQIGDVFVTEVAGSSEDPLPCHRLLDYRLRSEHVGSYKVSRNVQYQMSFQVETLPADIFLHVHDEILADGARRGFLHNFQPHHRLAVAPLGFVSLEGKPGCLVLHAFHTFPDERTIVKSQSLIEITK